MLNGDSLIACEIPFGGKDFLERVGCNGVDGVCHQNGNKNRVGANVLGDPIEALVWLVNARSRTGAGLRAGDIHNTGTATSIQWIEPGDEAVARFEGLGSVQVNFKA